MGELSSIQGNSAELTPIEPSQTQGKRTHRGIEYYPPTYNAEAKKATLVIKSGSDTYDLVIHDVGENFQEAVDRFVENGLFNIVVIAKAHGLGREGGIDKVELEGMKYKLGEKEIVDFDLERYGQEKFSAFVGIIDEDRTKIKTEASDKLTELKWDYDIFFKQCRDDDIKPEDISDDPGLQRAYLDCRFILEAKATDTLGPPTLFSEAAVGHSSD